MRYKSLLVYKKQMAKLFYFFGRIEILQSFLYFCYKIINSIINFKKTALYFGYCPPCAKRTLFLIGRYDREELRCIHCAGNSRQRLVGYIIKLILCYLQKNLIDDMDVLKKTLENRDYIGKSLNSVAKNITMKNYIIYEPDNRGPVHHSLKYYQKYVCSEYFPERELGKMFNNIRNEDLHNLSFSNNSLNMIITQDIFEHLPIPDRAFREIYRVLKSKGVHILTVPLGKISGRRKKTIKLIDENENILVFPVRYHQDIIDRSRSKVYTEWGYDLLDSLSGIGFFSFIVHFTNDLRNGIYGNNDIIISIKN